MKLNRGYQGILVTLSSHPHSSLLFLTFFPASKSSTLTTPSGLFSYNFNPFGNVSPTAGSEPVLTLKGKDFNKSQSDSSHNRRQTDYYIVRTHACIKSLGLEHTLT